LKKPVSKKNAEPVPSLVDTYYQLINNKLYDIINVEQSPQQQAGKLNVGSLT
jgi:hypothetical protein